MSTSLLSVTYTAHTEWSLAVNLLSPQQPTGPKPEADQDLCVAGDQQATLTSGTVDICKVS